MRFHFFAALVLFCTPAAALAGDKTIGVFVALADPKHQGIGPVPAALANGDDAETNLYWGNEEGLKGVFDHSRNWKLADKLETPRADTILSTRTYRRAGGGLVLIARAYRGSRMQQCIADYEEAVAHGQYDLVVFIGHNGLMDLEPPAPVRAADQAKKPDCVALCCISEQYFKPRLLAEGGRPVLLTTQLMYPGSFTLEALADAWADGGSLAAIRESAAAAYAKNQKISRKAARGVFSDLDSKSNR